jgi:hypothetical protein
MSRALTPRYKFHRALSGRCSSTYRVPIFYHFFRSDGEFFPLFKGRNYYESIEFPESHGALTDPRKVEVRL